ncbi:lipid droplet-associated hydrolase isoform X2 [Eurytemora carolleeae]|uniref:lipid droplet-associated hydrolase isoform X2 n=1 Tax=Eurytemora carolleeae TaxID=1294199 RepID=UPI000C76FABB|nr:lipid droplet-associated hydrolase isoform X2 [Eurytemora carolleeae]|eukprot:XP_023321164.1 lipid droplet-associated hydrolase-like isoform X2 [Eurytemora affinis]
MIFQDWVEWRGEKSSVVGVGHRVSGSLNNLHDKEMFLIIPGNPGLAGFYQEFMKSLHGKVGNPDLSIWALSHAGHHRPEVSWIPAEKTYGFEEQILHKLELIDRLIPQSTRITLIGHSIGCKIIMEIFKRNSTHSFTGVYFLFPTIENMVGTERGRQVYPLTTLLRIPCILILSLLYIILPKQILRTLLRRFLKDVPDSVLNTVHVLANPNYVNNCLVMAREELDTVLDLDTSTLKTMFG